LTKIDCVSMSILAPRWDPTLDVGDARDEDRDHLVVGVEDVVARGVGQRAGVPHVVGRALRVSAHPARGEVLVPELDVVRAERVGVGEPGQGSVELLVVPVLGSVPSKYGAL
jgi:hypothetical protein